MSDRAIQESLIQKQVAKFADAVNYRDEQAFKSLWIPRGVWDIQPPLNIKAEGVDSIVQTFNNLLSNWEFFVQMVHSGVVEVKENKAMARWCMNEIGRNHEGKGFQNFGNYEDELVYQDNNWLFVKRTYNFVYIEEPQLLGNAFSV